MSAWAIRGALIAALALAVGAPLFAVRDFEQTLASGRVVLAELAPVDPRSLMQGDYMALRFALDNELPRHPAGSSDARRVPSYAHIAVDTQGRATLAGLGDSAPADDAGLLHMRIRTRDGLSSIGPNAFFFEEGSAQRFEAARWGEFRVGANGKALLTHLRDERLERIGENPR